MARNRTVQRAKKSNKHLSTRNKKIQNTQREQGKIAGWNKKLSFTDNVNALGINNRGVNDTISKFIAQQASEPNVEHIEAEEITMDQLRRLNEMRVKPENVEKIKNKVRLTIDEEWAIEGLVEKYKTDWLAMKRDHKLNSFQWTGLQCEKKYKAFIKRHGECPKKK